MITADEHARMALYFRRCANSWAWMAASARKVGDPREDGFRSNADALRQQSREAAREARKAREARQAVPA